ncbi:MAG TPA: TonB-dependent receptor [Allosphingosinicella sp.]|jgi:vitamin B12 transporter
MNSILLLAAAIQQAPAEAPAENIVVTGSREAVPLDAAAVSATVYDREQLDALALPIAADVLRLSPGVTVATTGPRGAQTQLRIRGAEANHTLLFVDGIRLNDPAAGNEARFELFTVDGLSRIELVRGPQSALWGSEALGGVVAVETGTDEGLNLLGEYGSLDSVRAAARFGARSGELALSGSAGLLRSDGIDSFGGGGERDGFENRTASLKAVFTPLPATELGVVGHLIDGESAFDGNDPDTYLRADTLDSTGNRMFAVRGWAAHEAGGWSLLVDGSYLDSANRNRRGEDRLNSTFGTRFTLGGQLSRRFGGQRLTAAIEHEAEDFRTENQAVFYAPDQDRSRELTALIGEWRGEWSDRLITDVAVRHDRFSAFRDATTFRASALVRPATDWTLHAAYGEGIAQPGFFDLFGFYPNSFIGNPELRPESSKGWEAGLRWSRNRLSAGATLFSSRLHDEIVGTYDFATGFSSTANATGKSRRRGVELEAGYRWAGVTLAANYTYLDASERRVEGGDPVREVRRPKHSANLIATGEAGPLNWGAGLAYVGKRRDTDFDVFEVVTLGDYVLASLKLGYRITPAIEAYARVENAFDADYQDVVGYHTAGRTIYAGLRLRLD